MRRKHSLWAALAALTLAPVGCVEPEAKSKPAEKAPAAEPKRPADPPPAPPPVRASGPPLPDDTDPVVAAAGLSARRVAEHEERIDDALSAVMSDVQALSGSDVRAVDLTAEKLLAVVQQLRGSGERILDRYPKVKADLAGLGKATAGVKAGYGRAKELYLEKAGREAGDLKDRYLALADLCDAFRATCEARTAEYAAFGKDLERATNKVERHVEFLRDFEAFLKLHPGTQGAKERADFLASLTAFADQVLRFGDVLKQFRDRVRDGAVSMKLQAEHDRAVAAVRAEREKAVAKAAPDTATARAEPTRMPAREEVAVRRSEPGDGAAVPSVSTVAASAPAPCATAVRYVPVSVTRCVPTLVPVTSYVAQRGPLGRCRPVAVTRYEWRSRLVTETGYAVAGS